MKKQGFTISELLVALGIVAVTAAMVVPMFSSIIPDKNKMKVISYYNKINEINQKLLSDKNLFPTVYGVCDDEKISDGTCSEGQERYIIKYGLANQNPPIDQIEGWQMSDQAGPHKYYNLFFYTLNTTKRNNNGNNLDDGSLWYLEQTIINHESSEVEYLFTIDLDDKGANCSYSSTCKKPDTFKFKVDENGAVTAGDALTDAYLTNMTKNDRKADKELAKKYLKERKYLK